MGAPPTWNLDAFFPSFDAPERAAFEADLARDIATLGASLGALGSLRERDAFVAGVLEYERVLARLGHIASYVGCLVSVDSDDERYTLAEARMADLRAGFDKVTTGLRRLLGSATEEDFAACSRAPELEGASFFLSHLRREATRRMSPELEDLASELGTTGISAWGRLYDTLAGRLSFDLAHPDGRVERVPMAQRRSLMADADRRVREAAFTGGNRAWADVGDVVGAAINHIAGTRHTLGARRRQQVIDVALHDAALSRRTLDAMMESVKSGAPLARRGLRLKARAMGQEAIAWFDLEAPIPVRGEVAPARLTWDEGRELVRGAFGRAYPGLEAYFTDAIDRRWVEAAPGPRKRPGAYCTGSDVLGESRVFMTYQGSLGDVSTLAHEIGHAFHSHVLRDARVMARQYPMTLAETASTFAEHLLAEGLLSDPTLPAGARARLLGEIAGDAAAFLLDIPTRYTFESRFYEERLRGEVPARRACELMAEAQREIFGEALAPGGEDPWFWASKMHFFLTDVTFYNFPYTFGYLLSRGLYAAFVEEGPAFLPRYESFLRETGSGMAHEVARRTMGRDLEAPDFWADAIRTLEGPIGELERVVG